MKKKKIISCVMGFFLMCLTACGQSSEIYLEEYGEEAEIEVEMTAETETGQRKKAEDTEVRLCYVYICGAVNVPGVYALPEGSRVYEVIQAAGGLSEDAEECLLNQAEEVTDGMMLQVYTKEEAKELKSSASTGDGKLDINTASVTDLMNLPGIGKSKAEAIVAYRETEGIFSSIEDLMKIPGIKEGVFTQLKEHIKVKN